MVVGLDQKQAYFGVVLLVLLIVLIITTCKYIYYSYLVVPERRNRITTETFNGVSFKKKRLDYYGIGTIESLRFVNYPGKKIAFYCHGNGGNIATRQYVVNLMSKFKLNTFIFDYRGFGNSHGKPTEVSVLEDALFAYDYLLTKYKPEDIIIWGESLGGAAATFVASQRPCHKLVILSSFYSISHVINNNMDINKLLAVSINCMFINPDKNIPSHEWMAKVRVPTVVVHSKEDEIIPWCSGEKLYNSCKSKDKMFILIKGKHREPYFEKKQLKNLIIFLTRGEQNTYILNTEEITSVQEVINNI